MRARVWRILLCVWSWGGQSCALILVQSCKLEVRRNCFWLQAVFLALFPEDLVPIQHLALTLDLLQPILAQDQQETDPEFDL